VIENIKRTGIPKFADLSGKLFLLLACLVQIHFLTGCSSSKKSVESVDEYEEVELERSYQIFSIASSEQQNPMYSKEADTTILYWLNDLSLELNGFTKCNVFALNVLSKAGYITPDENCRTAELFDTTLYRDILPIVSVGDCFKASPGDLIVWNGHVIIYEKLIVVGEEEFALAWWAGTGQEDNGENIINNVCHGKYRLDGEYVVRRPLLK
jgi:hypothetical protein